MLPSLELFWREISHIYFKYKKSNQNINKTLLNAYKNLILNGFSFEIVEGEIFDFHKDFILDVF